MEKTTKKTVRKPADKAAIRTRLNRMRGQIDGIIKMVEDDRYCNDILIQLTALSKGARSLIELMLEQHLRFCVLGQIKEGNTKVVEEVIELTKRL